jgi:5-methylcytosine-specific restriction enzyme A
MPEMPKHFRPTGAAPIERRRAYDADRRAVKQSRRWYKLAVWIRKAKAQLQEHPLCERCEAEGRVTEATVANHRTPHREDWDRFINGELESTCKPCHDSVIQSEERNAGR